MAIVTDESSPRSRQAKSEKRRRNSVVSVRLTAEEREAIEQHARETGTQVGALMRSAALRTAASPETNVVYRSHGYVAPFNVGPTPATAVVVHNSASSALQAVSTGING